MARKAMAAKAAIFPTLTPRGRPYVAAAPAVESDSYTGRTCVGDAWRTGFSARCGGTEAGGRTRLEGRAALLIDRSAAATSAAVGRSCGSFARHARNSETSSAGTS